MADKLQEVLWCVHAIVQSRQIKKPHHPVGSIVTELNAYVELHILLRERA